MKKIFLGILALITFCFSAKAQKNNPYDGFGKEFVTSLQIISNDLEAGKIKQLDEATLAYYSKNIPLKNQINLTLVSDVFKTVKEGSVSDIIQNSRYSTFGKQILEKMSQKGDIIPLVDQVLTSKLESTEKENILKLLAVGYNMAYQNSQTTKHSTLNGGMYFIGGFLIGDMICGPVCGAAGALIGCFVEYIK